MFYLNHCDSDVDEKDLNLGCIGKAALMWFPDILQWCKRAQRIQGWMKALGQNNGKNGVSFPDMKIPTEMRIEGRKSLVWFFFFYAAFEKPIIHPS